MKLTALLATWLLTCLAAAEPTTAPRKTVIIPPNFQLIVVESRKAIAQEGDEAWVRGALSEKTPTSGPTTRPADLLQKLTERREVLIDRITSDLALADSTPARKLIDEQLIPVLRQIDEFRAPVFYLVTTQETLRNIVKQGWSDPTGRYYYNRAADKVSIDTSLQLTFDAAMNDEVLAVLYQTTDSFADRQRKLVETVHDTETKFAYAASTRAQFAAQMAYLNFISENGIKPLKLVDQQDWFGVGMAGVLSAEYLAFTNNTSADTILRAMSTDDPRNPIRSSTVDLIAPLKLAEMRDLAKNAYADAFRRRSTAVFRSWMDRAGPTGLPKVLKALRAAPAKDGAELVKVIKDQTGIDLTSELKPKP